MFNVLMMGLAILVASPEAKVEPKKESPKVEGVWILEKYEGTNKEVPESALITFKDGKVIDHQEKRPQKTIYKVDYTKSPIEIDLIDSDKEGAARALGIVKFEGDKMFIAVADAGARPKSFKVDDSERKIIMILKKK
jgi:uncharacterized protein (TIGR03067 family)